MAQWNDPAALKPPCTTWSRFYMHGRRCSIFFFLPASEHSTVMWWRWEPGSFGDRERKRERERAWTSIVTGWRRFRIHENQGNNINIIMFPCKAMELGVSSLERVWGILNQVELSYGARCEPLRRAVLDYGARCKPVTEVFVRWLWSSVWVERSRCLRGGSLLRCVALEAEVWDKELVGFV